MVRATMLSIVLFGLASAAASVIAQQPQSSCNLAAASVALKAGREPDFVGCQYPAAQRVLTALGYKSGSVPDTVTSGRRNGEITRQRRTPNLFIFSVVTPPAATEAPPVADPAAEAPAAAQPVSFSIQNAQAVTEGEKLVFPIRRDRNDGKPHRLTLSYSNPARLRDPPATIEILPLDSAPALTLQTVATPPGDGDQGVRVLIAPGDEATRIGAPRMAEARILDGQVEPVMPPSPAPSSVPTYSVDIIGQPSRSGPITFRIFRTGALPAETLPFEISESGNAFAMADTDRIAFAEGEASRDIDVTDHINLCSTSVGFAVMDANGARASTSWSFREPLHEDCNPPSPWWTPFVPPGRLWWLPPLVLILIGSIPFIRRLWRPDPPIAGTDVHASARIEPGGWAFDPPDEAMCRWPTLQAQVTIEPGDNALPDPLPTGDVTHE